MEVEHSLGVVNSCNFARKRQAAEESCTETKSKKRPCLEDCSWNIDNACNLETENRLLSYSQPTVITHQLHDYNGPLSSDSDTAEFSYTDVNCNIVNQEDNCQEMEISYSSTITRSTGLHQQAFSVPTLLVHDRSSLASCSRCLTGEPGHINHLSS